MKNLKEIIDKIQKDKPNHIIHIKDTTNFNHFDKDYQRLLELEDFQDVYLQTIRLASQIVQYHTLSDGNKRLSWLVIQELLINEVVGVYESLGQNDE